VYFNHDVSFVIGIGVVLWVKVSVSGIVGIVVLVM